MQQPKAGEAVTFTVGGNDIIVEAIPFGKLKKVIKIIADVSKKFDPKTVQEDILTLVPTVVEEYVDDLVPLLFDGAKHPFLTKDWINENLTIPKTKEIIVASIAVNGLGDFFVKTAKAPAPKPSEESGTSQTLSESSGSITSSDSPTDGDRRILTS
jgi:hypothetical protein